MLFVLIACAACSSHDDGDTTRARCEQLRDHLIDLRLHSVSPTPVRGQPTVDIRAHRAAMKQALGESFVANCQQNVPRVELDCELGAKDSSAIDACSKHAAQ